MTSNVVHIVFNAKWIAKSRASYDSTPTSPISVSAKKAGTAKPNDGLKKFCFWVPLTLRCFFETLEKQPSKKKTV